MMENTLRTLFEYQRFSPNRRLAEMTEEIQRRYMPLSDEELFAVAAAGEPELPEETIRRTLTENPNT